MLTFPNINWQYWYDLWINDIGNRPAYNSNLISPYSSYNGTFNECSNEIINLVRQNNHADTDILRIIDLIYHWGGNESRWYYVPRKNYGNRSYRDLIEEPGFLNTYKEGINLAKRGDPDSEAIFRSITGIGASFSGKHSFFWSYAGDTILLIVDTKIAGCFGFCNPNDFLNKYSYHTIVNEFTNKAIEIFRFNDPSLIEKPLFRFHEEYFLNSNTGWKLDFNSKVDYNEAKLIAGKLEIDGCFNGQVQSEM